MHTCLRYSGVSSMIAAQADVDGSNSIDFHEFCELWVSLTRPNEASLQEAKEILCKRSSADAALHNLHMDRC